MLRANSLTPNKDLWRHFDPSGAHDYVYNRFSLVTVGLLPKGSPVQWKLLNQSEFKLEIPADFPRQSQLSIKHAVSHVDDTATASILEQEDWKVGIQNSNWIVWTLREIKP